MRILLHLARLDPGEQRSARTVAADTGVPAAFASKLLSRLSAARIVRSQRGAQGGVMLARSPRDISLADVARALGEEKFLESCVLGLSQCSDVHPCPVHETWKEMREQLRRELLVKSLADFDPLELGPLAS